LFKKIILANWDRCDVAMQFMLVGFSHGKLLPMWARKLLSREFTVLRSSASVSTRLLQKLQTKLIDSDRGVAKMLLIKV